MSAQEQQRPPITLVLDQSAVLAYAAGSIHAVEPVAEVVTDRQRVGVTSVTLAEALTLLADPKVQEDT